MGHDGDALARSLDVHLNATFWTIDNPNQGACQHYHHLQVIATGLNKVSDPNMYEGVWCLIKSNHHVGHVGHILLEQRGGSIAFGKQTSILSGSPP